MKRKYIITMLLIGCIVVVLALWYAGSQFLYLQKAHATFDNYYTFRGCETLVKRTDTYGICKLPSGKEITIVKFKNEWYLQNDTPLCWGGICF